MKRKMICLALAAALVLSVLAGCGSKKERPAEGSKEETMMAVATGVEETEAPPEANLDLSAFSLSTIPWSSYDGITVNLTAVPSEYAEGQTAFFVIRQDEQEVVSAECEWSGMDYFASVDLNAGDGYSYYIKLVTASGAVSECPVNTPEHPYDGTLIDLASALDAYCNAMLEGAQLADGKLVIASGTAQVQTPQLTNSGEEITLGNASLVLTFNGEDIQSMPLNLTADDVPGRYVQELSNVTFNAPSMEDGQQLDMRMEVTLSDGRILTAPVGNWTFNSGAVESAVG